MFGPRFNRITVSPYTTIRVEWAPITLATEHTSTPVTTATTTTTTRIATTIKKMQLPLHYIQYTTTTPTGLQRSKLLVPLQLLLNL